MRDLGATVSVGIAAADPLRLGDELNIVAEAGAKMIHVDVMDGVFCGHPTFGPSLVAALPSGFVKDVHLMIDDPLSKIDAYVDAGATAVTFHVEATRHPHRLLQHMRDRSVVRGVALNPGTSVHVLEPLVEELDLVLVLAVNPGWSGQSFVDSTLERVVAVRKLLGSTDVVIGVDGAITHANAGRVIASGADFVVAGSAIYGAGSAAENFRGLLERVRESASTRR